jgi:SAM-dependent methyltransferase
VADFPFDLPGDEVVDRALRAFDLEGKIPRALDSLGPLGDRDVVLLDAAPRCRSAQISGLGARLTIVDRDAPAVPPGEAPSADGPVVVPGTPAATSLPDAAADAIVALWSALCAPAPDELAEVDRVLRPGGRLLVLQDYGRDDLDPIRGPERTAELVAWSRRDGWYLRHGFRLHVVHAFWTFESIEAAAELLRDAFGHAGQELGARLRRPRLAHNVVLYHRTRGELPRPGAAHQPAGDRA